MRAPLAEALVRAARRLDALGLVPAMDGNLSARLSPDTLLITRTQVRKRDLTVEDLVEVGLEGTVRGRGRASSELGLHLTVYAARPDVAAIVHAHPPVACAFAVAGRDLTRVLMPEAVVALGPVPLAPYATPGTPAMDEAVAPLARDHDAFLLAHHGAVTTGSSVEQALDRMETLEHVAKVTAVADLLGGAKSLPEDQIQALLDLRRSFG